MSNILLILFPTQLFEQKYLNNIFKYTEDDIKIKTQHICLWEHPYFFTKFSYHKMKLVFHRASSKWYWDEIQNKYKKFYVEWDKKESMIKDYIQTHRIDQIRFFNPIEKELIKMIMENKIFGQIEKLVFPSPYFLNSSKHNTNTEITNELGGLRHDLFYKSQRIKYDIMVKKSGDKFVPEGSSWSFDTFNRKPFEKNQKEPVNLSFSSKKRGEYLGEAVEYVEKNFSKHYGSIELSQFIYPINRTESIEWLKYFVKNKLDNFGKYEDAMSSEIKFGFHSVLSPLTNTGMITPFDIIEHVKMYKKNIASKEGFIRQVIGWREYCYFTYDLYGNNLSSGSFYKFNKHPIPKKVWECFTQIPPIDNILKNVTANAYSHHIERLMGIGNFLILIETDLKEIYNWFQTMYIDAYDVFMVPNVYGMLGYGKLTEKSRMMTRPYFASSNYLMKMSNFKSEECVEINSKTYKWDEIMDSLYWSFVSVYSDEFASIYSTASAVSRWNKFDSKKKKDILELSKIYKNWIHQK
jgi:deoxyribodipyrimidine photolyase-related protein